MPDRRRVRTPQTIAMPEDQLPSGRHATPADREQARIGVLGGSFNPIHNAHLFTAEVAAAGHGLVRVLLVPAARSPLKEQAGTSAGDRLRMVRLAAAENPLFEVSTVDLDRPPPSYTVDTMTLLQAQYPGADLHLILGTDALADLLEWREPERLLDLCRLIVVSRPGHALGVPAHIRERLGERVGRILLQQMPLLEISSTDIRRRLGTGDPVRYLVPDGVLRYISERGLYTRSKSNGGASSR